MKKAYPISTTHEFDRCYKKLIKNNVQINKLIANALFMLSGNPFDQSLKTHKINSSRFGKVYSSRVNGDIRILWSMTTSGEAVILCLTIGGHDRVY